MAQIVISPRDDLVRRYAAALDNLGPAKAHKVMARAMNYEGKSAFVVVKRVLRAQTSIPRPIVERSTNFVGASTGGGALETKIVGRGSRLSMRLFAPKQFQAGTKVTVWGRRQLYDKAFMYAGSPNSGKLIGGGAVFKNTHERNEKSKRNNKIKAEWGPSVPVEMVKDQTAAAFYASAPKIIERVGKEIAAVLRGF